MEKLMVGRKAVDGEIKWEERRETGNIDKR